MRTRYYYEEYEAMVMGAAWKWHASTGVDLRELQSEAMAIFGRILAKYDPKRIRAKFGTYLHTSLRNGLMDFTRKWNKDVTRNWDWDNMVGPAISPARTMLVKDSIEHLSEEGRHVADIILTAPGEILGLIGGEPPRKVRGMLVEHLKDEGWSTPRIFNAFREIRELLADL